MAYGQHKSELDGKEALLAVKMSNHSQPLPPSGTSVTLSYPGKMTQEAVLVPVDSHYKAVSSASSRDAEFPTANGLVWADNWFALHSILQSGQRAKLVYLDPPYATGMEFQSRDQEHAYADSLSNASYIEFMRRRLILLREIMSDDGSIYIHIGHQMLAGLKMVMDEVFGAKNFRNIITRRKCSSKNFTKNQYSNLNDYILFYSKGPNYIWNQPNEKPDAAWIAKEYTKVDTKGQYKLVPIHAPGIRKGETGMPWKGMSPPPGKHWQLTPSKLDELDAAGDIHWSKNGNPRRKVYLPPNKGIPLTDYWDKYRDAHHQSILITGYPTEKNFDMMKMIVSASSNPGDLVIDPFNGSGSTVHAAELLNRKWIGIDQSLVAIKTTIARLSNGRKPMGDFVKKDAAPDLFESNKIVAQHEEAVKNFDVFIDGEIAATYESELREISTMIGYE